jgi:hypothetical protein
MGKHIPNHIGILFAISNPIQSGSTSPNSTHQGAHPRRQVFRVPSSKFGVPPQYLLSTGRDGDAGMHPGLYYSPRIMYHQHVPEGGWDVPFVSVVLALFLALLYSSFC